MTKRLAILMCGALVAAAGTSATATVLHVPGEYPTIQAGIDAAVGGDTVLVADGIYTGEGNRDLDFGGVNMVVMSENGPEVTIIDCEADSLDPHRGFYFHSGEDSTSAVKGFSIRNGCGADGLFPQDNGGGILCYSSSPTIKGNRITANAAESNGGGIYCYASSATIKGNTISGNMVGWNGGGIFCYDCSGIIEGNAVTGNTAGWGGGIHSQWCSPTIKGNTIEANTAIVSGGGIWCSDSPTTVTIEANAIAGNTAVWGAGICSSEACPSVVGNIISDNAAGEDGGGIYCHYSASLMRRNTVTGNTAKGWGGGIYLGESSATALNCVLWGDSAGIDHEICLAGTSSIAITYSDIEGGWEGVGNIDADPMFVLADKQDYRLLWESPCIDAGHPDSLDPDGTRSDMGAHFFDQDDYMTLYLTPDATEIVPGGQFGLTFTLINRWAQPETLWMRTRVTLPNGNTSTSTQGPYSLPPDFTVQRHTARNLPFGVPLGLYGYRVRIGVPPSTLYDEDSFTFTLVEP
ncbi:hypothetical protein AMJ39_05290 [candidate division TA06 bacterium DG_24]|uniref:Periplasmic copper-binding protein NosD beta helix domain-containing protein n=3 Tax=Bacteria division TA06 TaxID=1156500 RepID=A0A0S8JND5_UNCT6|nr:MAG: hypothetical protein AMJ39_05290 [candidate division TA06 bacterium DG_24]KPK69772.1 MAG: hypothetical protein AMJ82_04855 [candidate division TA06 bacterium SM23_40]KPL10142.1 MAG: hypothetical protein AMJ71_04270 [candidate division TA06 bacterium SM1_40]